jgi:hypothetical protein
MMDGRMFDECKVKATFVTEVDFSRAKMGEWVQHGLGLPGPPMGMGAAAPLPGPPPM